MYRVQKMSSKSIKTINNYFLDNVAFLASNVCISVSISFFLLIPISILEWTHCNASFDKFFFNKHCWSSLLPSSIVVSAILILFLLNFISSAISSNFFCCHYQLPVELLFLFFDLCFSLLVLHFLFCFHIQLVFCIRTFH